MGLTSINHKKHHAKAQRRRGKSGNYASIYLQLFSAPLRALREIFLSLILLFSFSFLYAAENPLSLSSEITRLEKIGSSAVSSQERYNAFLTLAKLYQLSGNNESALKAWENALKINNNDGRSLLEKGRLLISAGEYEKALEPLAAILTGNYAKALLLEARFLIAQLEAFHSGNLRPLAALADDADFSEYRRLIYYTLWKIDQNPAWKALLTKDFPLSPEAKIASGTSGANSKTLSAQTPLWLLFPGRENIDLIPSVPATTPAPAPAQSAAVPAPAPPATTAPPTAKGSTVLQTGLFSREENARVLSEKINKAGFQSVIQTKQQNGASFWAVYVPTGADMNATIKKLKDAGFESFPVTVN